VFGIFSDWLIRRGATVGLRASCRSLAAADFHGDHRRQLCGFDGVVIAFLALAFFGNGLASITWSLVSTLAPARLLGLTGGVFNFIGNLSAIATPIVIGFLASGDSFAPAITYIAVLALLGALSYILLVGKVERIELCLT
jgi:ACS family D-galactonate transporter-like MFS transporter